ncbi:MAG: DUF348 domain-containing protein [Chloroflexi bacterium]|nr:DUF348 domain-containing protein [Chloroflexota bacterium]
MEPDRSQPEWPPRSEPRPRPLDLSPTASPQPDLASALSRRWPLLIVGSVLVAALLLLIAALLPTPTYTVIVDGAAYQISTRAGTVAALLRELEITLGANDRASHDLDSAVEPGAVIRIDRARSVSLTVNGQTQVFQTALTQPAAILDRAGIRVRDTDTLLIDGLPTTASALDDWRQPVRRIELRQPLPLHVIDDGVRRTLRVAGPTVGEALFAAGITVYLADEVSVDLNTPVRADLEVTIQRAKAVSIQADGDLIRLRTQGATVADALIDAGIALMGLDYTRPAETTALRPGLTINVLRVTETFITQRETLPFAALEQPDASLPTGATRLIQAGENGLRQTRFRVRYENGVEVAREREQALLLSPPVDQIMAVGTGGT